MRSPDALHAPDGTRVAAPRRIVVGADGSEGSARATRFARRLAEQADGQVVLACVHHAELEPGFAPDLPWTVRDAQAAVDAAAPLLEGFGAWRSRIVAERTAARGLREAAAAEDADLVVIGPTHHGRAVAALTGAVARPLIHGAPWPVVVAGGEREVLPAAPTVTCAYDASPESDAALAHAAAWAGALGGRLRLVHVVHPPLAVEAELGPVAYRETIDAMEEEARTRMASARDRVGAAGATVDVLVGEPVHTLREVAAVSDLLVVGSRGHGVLGSVLLGGVSGPLAAHADGPVLVVPRPG